VTDDLKESDDQLSDSWLDELKWDEQGLIPAIAQDKSSGRVLMMAWMNREALATTVETGQAVYWSRSRGRLWHKGESSGNTQTVADIRTDCDADVVLLMVSQQGGIACHTGRQSCFFRQLQQSRRTDQSWRDAEPVLKDPSEMYPDNPTDGEA